MNQNLSQIEKPSCFKCNNQLPFLNKYQWYGDRNINYFNLGYKYMDNNENKYVCDICIKTKTHPCNICNKETRMIQLRLVTTKAVATATTAPKKENTYCKTPMCFSCACNWISQHIRIDKPVINTDVENPFDYDCERYFNILHSQYLNSRENIETIQTLKKEVAKLNANIAELSIEKIKEQQESKESKDSTKLLTHLSNLAIVPSFSEKTLKQLAILEKLNSVPIDSINNMIRNKEIAIHTQITIEIRHAYQNTIKDHIAKMEDILCNLTELCPIINVNWDDIIKNIRSEIDQYTQLLN